MHKATTSTSKSVSAGSTAGAERRAFVRYPTDLETACLPIHGKKDEGWAARARDISAGGICLVCQRRFEPGTVLSIEINAGNDGPKHTVLARVAWISKDSSHQWAHGCKFGRPLSDHELAELTGPRSGSGGAGN